MSGKAYPRTIPRSADAVQKLTPETLQSLTDYYSSDALVVTTDKGDYDPSKQRAKWIKSALKESPEIAEYCISRLLWHHNNQSIKLINHHDFRHIVGLLQFDDSSSPWLSREQEVAMMKVTRAIYSVRGNTGFTRNYGDDIIGTWILNESIGRYTLENYQIADTIALLIRERGLMEGSDIAGLMATVNHNSLIGGAL